MSEYILDLRKLVGHRPLLQVGASVLLEDEQGRLLLPQKMRAKYLDNCREVEISGAKNYIRILKSETGEAEDETFRNDFPDPLAFLAEVQRSARGRNE